MEHQFTDNIYNILEKYFGKDYRAIYNNSPLLQYINIKTRSANRGSKSRASFANLYAICVILEDYLSKKFDISNNYSQYEGANFSDLLIKQRKLPFGDKLQNHALNNRLNSEFQKYFPSIEQLPIIRNLKTNKYWFNESLIIINFGDTKFNISKAIIDIINNYVEVKQSAFIKFIHSCEKIKQIKNNSKEAIEQFITSILTPNTDARLFEIASYSILKYYYKEQVIYWGFDLDSLKKENLKLYKTGKTNANDGGIDFVMKPTGRFFQATESLDLKKYFLDIDKVQKYPITFVVKSDENIETILKIIEQNARKYYSIDAIISQYMNSIEEIINIPRLLEYFQFVIEKGNFDSIIDEIILQSRIEFNL